MRWVSNAIQSPENAPRMTGQTQDEANVAYWLWRKRHDEGPPKATESCTVEQLQEMGIIGLYAPDTACVGCGRTLDVERGSWCRACRSQIRDVFRGSSEYRVVEEDGDFRVERIQPPKDGQC